MQSTAPHGPEVDSRIDTLRLTPEDITSSTATGSISEDALDCVMTTRDTLGAGAGSALIGAGSGDVALLGTGAIMSGSVVVLLSAKIT